MRNFKRFSVLMSIYCKEKSEHFHRSMRSIWDEQSVRPDEIILVLDGQLTQELYEAIDYWKAKLKSILKIVLLDQNVGLGDALNEGIKYCSHELIARMDTDDISMPYRFERQLEVFENCDVDICGGWVAEFDRDENKIVSYRKVPERHCEVTRFAKKRNPMNHPTVMFKKSAVERAGGYQKMMWFEDYYLWVRMILTGAKFYNLQEVLLKMRAGEGLFERRRGLNYAKKEIELQKIFLKVGFINYFEFARNVVVRSSIRVMPRKIVRLAYRLLRR